MTETIRILGIDPGLRATGWGVVDQTGARLAHVAHGVIRVEPSAPLAVRLAGIFSEVSALVLTHRPHAAGVEETLVNAGARSALKGPDRSS